MKKKGSNSEIKDERDNAIMRAFRRLAAQHGVINMPDILYRLVREPSPRFWVSEERATIVVSEMMRGAGSKASTDNCSRMFAEICRRVEALRASRPLCPLVSLVREVIVTPAPELYLSQRTVHNIICRRRKSLSYASK